MKTLKDAYREAEKISQQRREEQINTLPYIKEAREWVDNTLHELIAQEISYGLRHIILHSNYDGFFTSPKYASIRQAAKEYGVETEYYEDGIKFSWQ
jgi:hypothetical protein